uniref:Zinc finger protein 654 n=1 Tax=Nothobranchius furzeri TaxID=105023 RepID=A0A8C6LI30_NOTFU
MVARLGLFPSGALDDPLADPLEYIWQPEYALDSADSMADNESDLEIDGLETALDTLCLRHCSKESSLNSKEYCSDFCELVEEYTGQWHVPLPQLKVLRTALCNFTKATAAFPDDCQHVQYVLSSLALSFFELMLFFSKEEFIEEPLKDILDTFQECHCRLLRHRNVYLQHVKQTIKGGGPWESPVLQGILKETDLPPNEVEDFLSSELPIFLELRVRYLQACERVQEVMALAKCCLENHETGKHLYFHQAYLTCLFKASLYENLQKEMAEIDGRDAVEIICNTESVEKDEFLLSLCRAFLTRQLHKGDMYYIWDLVFIWSRLYLRAHPSRQGFLAECLQLASSATNVRAIFPIIKLVTTELGAEGVQVCVELCCRALQLVDLQADAVTQSLVCKTIAFLLPHDLEICRACALLVFCQERSLEAYRTVCLLYRHPDEEQHPHSNAVRTSVRFPLLQMLKERLCFDPEFWNLFTLRTHCLELMSDNVMKDAELSEIKEEQEEDEQKESELDRPGDTSVIGGSGQSEHTQEVSRLSKTTWRERVLRTQQYRNCAYSCKFCDKTYKGMNVMRHAIAHLKMRKLKCIFCGKRFKVLNLAKNHVMEHIEEMCKQTPCEPSVKEAPPANGIMGNVENESQPQDENLVSVSQKEPKRKSTVCSLSREERIIKNTRILFRKSFMPQKKGPSPETQVKKQVDFKDEQVVITNDLVMVKNVTLLQTEEEDKNVPAGENGQGLDLTYHLCPSEACDKVFLKISSSLTRHALKCHINEDQVLEKAFVWSKHKCVFCTRLTQFLQQYKEHMMLHSDPLPHLCYHLECKRRFSTQQELKDHIRTHDPLRLQCQYSNCDKLFSNFQTLYDHEWRHYIPVPLKEELDVEHSKAVQPSEEAPWKQRVKVEELWLQNKKGQRESPTPGIHVDGNEMAACGTQTTDLRTNVPEQDSSAETVSHEPLKDKSTINGYEEIIPTSHVDGKSTPSKNRGKQPRTFCPINVKDGDEIYTLVEGVHKNIAEPHIIEHKTFKPEDPAYARFVKTPFVRPPPSTYLDESVLSMRKKRSKKDSVTKKQPVVVDPEPKVRHRCDNCLTLFCTKEELQKHQALNTCSSLFGFDSDDES